MYLRPARERDADEHEQRRCPGARADRLPEEQAGPDGAKDRLEEQHLPARGDPAQREAFVPGEEREEGSGTALRSTDDLFRSVGVG